MRKTIGLILILLLAAPALASPVPSANLQFDVPARINGSVEISHGQRLLIIFPMGAKATGFAQMTGLESLEFQNQTMSFAEVSATTVGGARWPITDDIQHRSVNWSNLRLDFQGRLASLYIEASDISAAGNESVSILDKGQGVNLSDLAEITPSDERAFMDNGVKEGEAYALFRSAPLKIHATGLTKVAWFEASVQCAADCPNGGGRTRTDTTGPQALDIAVETDSFEQITARGGALDGTASGARVLLGGSSLDAVVDGSIRLPFAAGHTECQTCNLPKNQTLSATGHLLLDSIVMTGNHRARASFSGDVQTVRADEQTLSPLWLGAAIPVTGTVVALTSLALVTKILIGALFTRHKKDPLNHPRRQAIYAYVCAHPGASFREVAREVDIAAGTARHHLTVLKRSGLVVEHPFRSSVRFFENHGKFAHNWRETVMLREPALAILEDWIKANPGAPQKDALNAMADLHGWSRSTTQHRLGRLVGEGLAHIVQSGRLLMYKPGPRPGTAKGSPVVTPPPRPALALPFNRGAPVESAQASAP